MKVLGKQVLATIVFDSSEEYESFLLVIKKMDNEANSNIPLVDERKPKKDIVKASEEVVIDEPIKDEPKSNPPPESNLLKKGEPNTSLLGKNEEELKYDKISIGKELPNPESSIEQDKYLEKLHNVQLQALSKARDEKDKKKGDVEVFLFKNKRRSKSKKWDMNNPATKNFKEIPGYKVITPEEDE